jgi:hypothetical protein
MEHQSETARVDRELELAHEGLRETLEQVNQKIHRFEARLRPQAIVRRNPVALPLLAGLLGFFAGCDDEPGPLRWIIVGSLIGTALAATHGSAHSERNRTSN